MAYFWKNKLHTWYRRSNLDKTIQSFIVGAIISTITVRSFNPPLSSQTFAQWGLWIEQVGLPFFLLEPLVILLVMLIITLLMQVAQDYRRAPTVVGRRLTILAVVCIAGLAAVLVAYVTIPLVVASPVFHEYAPLTVGVASIAFNLLGFLSNKKVFVRAWVDTIQDLKTILKRKATKSTRPATKNPPQVNGRKATHRS